MATKLKVFVYKEYNDDNAYGEELIELYPSREAAESRLKERIVFCCDRTLEDLRHDPDYEDENLEDDHVSFDDGKGTAFFIVEEKEVELSPDMILKIAKHNDRENKKRDIKKRYSNDTEISIVDDDGNPKRVKLDGFTSHERRQITEEVLKRLDDALAVDDVFWAAYESVMDDVMAEVVREHYIKDQIPFAP